MPDQLALETRSPTSHTLFFITHGVQGCPLLFPSPPCPSSTLVSNSHLPSISPCLRLPLPAVLDFTKSLKSYHTTMLLSWVSLLDKSCLLLPHSSPAASTLFFLNSTIIIFVFLETFTQDIAVLIPVATLIWVPKLS
ncbi:hypothetical protein C8J57DRAFT_1530386 [Mycena rebaudengoi]|nr:hypothetical protein C8J57DRAFT_1530386 [Mycena rebaudengoi]